MRSDTRFIGALLTLAVLFPATASIAAPPSASRPSSSAGVPSPVNAEIPCQINLVGTTLGVPDPAGNFKVVVRDLANNPLLGVAIDIDFGVCRPDIQIAIVQPYPGLAVTCSRPVGVVSAITDVTGTARFCIVGGANNSGAAPGAGFQCARAYADGVLLGYINVGAFDENGVGGVNPADISAWLSDFFHGVYVGRSDFTTICGNGPNMNPADLSMLLNTSISGTSRSSAASYCH